MLKTLTSIKGFAAAAISITLFAGITAINEGAAVKRL
jgi:hypothetical protein